MTQKTNAVSIKILNKEYRINCPIGEEESLIRSANYVEEKMREVRTSGKIISLDRLAIMAALNIAHELVSLKIQLENQDFDHSTTSPVEHEENRSVNNHHGDKDNAPTTAVDQHNREKLYHIQTLINKKLTEYRGQFEDKED
ncbi:MAG TPA: cell division protein ZapA [Thiothrix sp.]|nr:cell division protein ZapA [Thiothrix sp.]